MGEQVEIDDAVTIEIRRDSVIVYVDGESFEFEYQHVNAVLTGLQTVTLNERYREYMKRRGLVT